MLNKYPLWKYVLIVVVVVGAFLYALPNVFGEDPALQISSSRGAVVDAATQRQVQGVLTQNRLAPKEMELANGSLLVRFRDTDTQLKAQDAVRNALGSNYVVALNLAPATPGWLRAINALPMYLGLDLRGGVHFLMEVDMSAVAQQNEERLVNEARTMLRDQKIRYAGVTRRGTGGIEIHLRNPADLQSAEQALRKEYPELQFEQNAAGEDYVLVARLAEPAVRELRRNAVQQNVTTLRNRVNELGVAEPVIQQQGEDRIVVQLPGVQDTARAKEILGATATLEFRLVDERANVQDALGGRVPVGSRLYKERNGNPILLQKRVIITGESVIDAASGIDQRDGSPAVFITLDGKGARSMENITRENVGKLMAVVFIENKVDLRTENGQTVRTKRKVEEVINVARIREPLNKRFQITGLDNTDEARDLALLLRAGALSAPIDIVEERTVGPSLGQENIERGFNSTLIGFALISIFMAVYYRVFGVLASVSLFVNMVMLVALLSLLQATLTLPGIAGLALTLGMAIDANVLIFERIREELRNGNTPQAAIHTGFERAFGTIVDSNLTTLIAGFALFLLGSGPVRGFAVVLCLGILTSMFSAVLVTRGMVNLIYGQRKLSKLAI